MQNFAKKRKKVKFGTKNALFGYFLLECENIGIIKISTLKFCNCKILLKSMQKFVKKKKKYLSLELKMNCLGIFGLQLENNVKQYCYISNQLPVISLFP